MPVPPTVAPPTVAPPIVAPAGYVPELALAFADTGGLAQQVSGATPLPVDDRAYASATAIVPGVDQPPRRAIAIMAGGAGTVVIKLADDSLLALPVDAGLSILPFAVKTVVVAGTTATASFASLS